MINQSCCPVMKLPLITPAPCKNQIPPVMRQITPRVRLQTRILTYSAATLQAGRRPTRVARDVPHPRLRRHSE